MQDENNVLYGEFINLRILEVKCGYEMLFSADY